MARLRHLHQRKPSHVAIAGVMSFLAFLDVLAVATSTGACQLVWRHVLPHASHSSPPRSPLQPLLPATAHCLITRMGIDGDRSQLQRQRRVNLQSVRRHHMQAGDRCHVPTPSECATSFCAWVLINTNNLRCLSCVSAPQLCGIACYSARGVTWRGIRLH